MNRLASAVVLVALLAGLSPAASHPARTGKGPLDIWALSRQDVTADTAAVPRATRSGAGRPSMMLPALASILLAAAGTGICLALVRRYAAGSPAAPPGPGR